MSWFRRDPPPPLPPPKSKIPGWINIVVPLIFAIIIGLLSIVYNGLAEEVKTKADKETTLKAIEANQHILEKHQQTLDEALKVIIEMQTERRIQQQYIPTKQPEPQQDFSNIQQPSLPITIEQFEKYMKMSHENKAAFRKIHPSYESLPK